MKKDSCSISVIVPVYNAEKNFKRCVDSILNQTYQHIEIILVDDGSPDKCGELCDEYAQLDSRIKVLHQDNRGQAAARNRGIDVAKGELIAFVDADDHISPDMYEKLYCLLVQYSAEIACCGTIIEDENGSSIKTFANPLEETREYNQSEALGEHLNNIRITSSLCDKLYMASVFQNVRMIEGMIFEDLEVLPRCLAKVKTVVHLAEPLYHYVMTQNSTLREAFNSRQFDAMKAAQLRAEFYDEVCPEHSTIAWDIFLETCLTLIHRSYSFPDCDAQRDETLRRINSIVVKIGFNKLRLKTRIKLRMLQLGVPIYSVLMKTYIELDGFIRRTKTNLKGIRKE